MTEYTLFVSRNAGISYFPEATSTDIDELRELAEEFDKQHLRWSIEDEEGNPVGLCTIHAEIFAMMTHLRRVTND